MAIRTLFAPLASAFMIGVVACAMPSLASAGGPATNAPAAKPRPDLAKKVYTNDDLGWQSATPAPPGNIQPEQASGAVPVAGSAPANLSSAPSTQSAQLNPEQDPQWYAEQVARMEAQLADVEGREAQLQAFRASGALPESTGLVLNAPCEGITTDNLIAQLDAQRQQIDQQIDDLDDMAHANGLPSGVIAQASPAQQRELSAERQRAALLATYQQLSNDLTETQAVTADMQQQAAAQGITLIPPTPGAGGNMTTDLLSRLDARTSNLQNEVSGIEDDALSLGAQPGDLR